MRHSPPSAAQSGRVSRSRAMPVGGPHRENWPALQAVRVASSVGGTCRDGSHPDDWGMRRRGPAGLCRPEVGVPLPAGPSLPVGYAPSREPIGVFAAAALRAAVPEVGVPSRPRAFSPSAVRSTHAGRMERHRNWFRAPARCRSETGAPRSRCRRAVRGMRREGSHPDRLGFRPPRPCGPLCRPEVGVPSRPRASSRLAMGVSRRCRPLCRAPLGGLPGGRRSKASSRLFSVCGARHSRWQDGASSARVSRSRAMPVGDRRSSRPGACSRSVVRGTHAGRMERHRRGFRAPARCRSETGAPGRARACSPSAVRGTHAGRMERHRRGFRAPARCRSETGAPGRARACSRSVVRGTHGGGMERYRYWFRAPARCRSEDRRSWPCAALTVAGGNVIGAGFALPRDAGLKTGAPGGGLYQMEAGGPGRRPLGGTPAESSTPVGERTALPADRRRWRSPAVPRRSCSSRWSRCSGRSSRGSTG